MSINNSYFSRNNTIIYKSFTNTGKSPVTELFYGNGGLAVPIGYSRFIFDIDLTLLKEKVLNKTISMDQNCGELPKHTFWEILLPIPIPIPIAKPKTCLRISLQIITFSK